jgi:hypothetical protein
MGIRDLLRPLLLARIWDVDKACNIKIGDRDERGENREK